jgi:hypothetical protein
VTLPVEKLGVGNAGDVGVFCSDEPSAAVSGRQPDLPPELMAAVRELAPPSTNVLLVGSHGAQWAGGDPAVDRDPATDGEAIVGAQPEDVVPGMDEQVSALLARVASALGQIGARRSGSFVAHKPVPPFSGTA